MGRSCTGFAVVIVLLALVGAARADYAGALRDGRGRARAGDWPGAIAAFREALVARPHDAAALSELGWACFRAGEFEAARASTEEAIAVATSARLKAASLYNLGRIEEALGHVDAARAAYQRSVDLRPLPGVRAQLAALMPASQPAGDALDVGAMDGPQDDLERVCGAEFKRHSCDLSGAPESALARPAAPYLEVRVAATDTDAGTYAHYLLVRTERGWFYLQLFDAQQLSGRWGTRETLSVTRLALEDVVPGGAPEIVLRYHTESRTGTDSGVETDDHDWLVVCGVGASAPACTQPLAVGGRRGVGKIQSWRLDAALGAGRIGLRVAAGRPPSDVAALVGTHELRWP